MASGTAGSRDSLLMLEPSFSLSIPWFCFLCLGSIISHIYTIRFVTSEEERGSLLISQYPFEGWSPGL